MIVEDTTLGHLIHMIGRMQVMRADQGMERMGLHRGQARLLLILSDHEGITHSEIAEKLDISPAAATKVIKRMEAKRYLQRRPDPKDERVSRVYLQEDGWALIHQIRDVFRQVDQMLLRDFSPEELRLLRQPLERMHQNLLDPAGGCPE